MITLDLSNIWAQASLPELLALEPELVQAHQKLLGLEEGGVAPAWAQRDLWETGETDSRLDQAAQRIREQSALCLVLAPRGLCLGVQGVVQALQGPDRNLGRDKGDPALLFLGDSLSTYAHNALVKTLEGKDFSLILVSPQGREPEFAAASRCLRWMLERKYGTEEAARRIYAITEENSDLGLTAREQGWERFDFAPEGPFDCLSPRWLLPMAVAGVDIAAFRVGAAEAGEERSTLSFENPLWLHVAVRTLLSRGGRGRELFATAEPWLEGLGRWYCHLFARDRVAPGFALLPRDSLDREDVFATALAFQPPEKPAFLDADWKNRDGLGSWEGKPLDALEEKLWEAAANQADRGCPVLNLACEALDSRTLGQLTAFFALSQALSGCLQGYEVQNSHVCGENLAQLLGQEEPETAKENSL